MQEKASAYKVRIFLFPLSEIPRRRQVRQLSFLSHNGVDPPPLPPLLRLPLYPSSHFHDNNKVESNWKVLESGKETMQSPRRPFPFVFSLVFNSASTVSAGAQLRCLNSNLQQQVNTHHFFICNHKRGQPQPLIVTLTQGG